MAPARSELRAVSVMLWLLALCLKANPDLVTGPPGGPTVTQQQLLQIPDVVLSEVTSLDLDEYRWLTSTCGSVEQIRLLLSHVHMVQTKGAGTLLQQLMRVLPFLTLGSPEKIRLLIDHFQPELDFDEFDVSQPPESVVLLESLCALSAEIATNCMGNLLKDMFIEIAMVERAFI